MHGNTNVKKYEIYSLFIYEEQSLGSVCVCVWSGWERQARCCDRYLDKNV